MSIFQNKMEYSFENIRVSLNKKIDDLFNSYSYSDEVKEPFKLFMDDYVIFYANQGIEILNDFIDKQSVSNPFGILGYPYIKKNIDGKLKELNQEIDQLLLKEVDKEFKKVKIVAEKQLLKEREIKRKAEMKARRKGYSNIKPVSFYDEMYTYGDIEEDKEHKYSEMIYDYYFEKRGIPKRKKSKNEYLYGIDHCFFSMKHEQLILIDTPEGNQKHLDRCKEIVNILIILRDCESYQSDLSYMIILQKYLTEGYLITRQIDWYPCILEDMLIDELSTDPNDPHLTIRNHPAKDYKLDFYSDNFNIEQIHKDVDKFVMMNKKLILTSIEELKKFLKEHNNEITVVRYASLINKTYKVTLRILKGFVKEKKLKSKNIGSSHKLIFYI